MILVIVVQVQVYTAVASVDGVVTVAHCVTYKLVRTGGLRHSTRAVW